MSPFKVKRADFVFYKTIGFCLTSNIIISWFIYASFSENYLGYQLFNNIKYLFQESLRPDFIIYLIIIPLMTTFWNIMYQSWYGVKYIVKSYPIMYMMCPFFLDNFYFLLNHVPSDSIIEIQFVFISTPTVLQYQILTIFYLIVGFIVLFKAEKIRYVVIAIAFAIAEFSSLVISSAIEPKILEPAIYIAILIPTFGIFIGNQLRIWYLSFQNHMQAYLVVYILLVVIIILIIGSLRYRLGKDWWEKKPREITASRVARLIELID